MVEASQAFREAVVGDKRRVLLRVVVDISDPDITYPPAASSAEAEVSQLEQIHDKVFALAPPRVTLEANRWLLDGSQALFPASRPLQEETGFVGAAVSGADGAFSAAVWAEVRFDHVFVLQACSVYFPAADVDGVADTFTVEVRSGGSAVYSQTFQDNRENHVDLHGFTVYHPDAIRVTVAKWSLPGRLARLAEIVPGYYTAWDGGMLEAFSVVQQGNVSCMSLPYGTCSLTMDNTDRRFEPLSKDGLFQSIEERQALDIYLGVELADGNPEYKRVGLYYQANDGWRTGENAPTMRWDLVDVIGLLVNRTFLPPDTLPTTLEGWLQAIAGQLGENFAHRYIVDPAYANLPVTASREDIEGLSCGDILRFVCMATGTWPRADNTTGRITVEPLWSQGNRLELDNLTGYPGISANDEVAALLFTLSDGTEYVVSGTSASAGSTLSIKNPFIHTAAQALTAARLILATYGGNKLTTTGRGDPTSEIGDVDTVWLNQSSATTGRRVYQTFNFSQGVMQGCQSTLLQADGSFLFQARQLFTASGTFTAPAGVRLLRVILGQGGQGSGRGQDGILDPGGAFTEMTAAPGEQGVSGSGGKVWYGTVPCNEGQSFAVSIGQGGAAGTVYGQPGAEGGHTTFGTYSSANGEVYPLGFTDVAGGESFGRSGVAVPVDGSGDGAQGGAGGTAGIGYWRERTSALGNVTRYFVTVQEPGPGQAGRAGAAGFALIYWDKESAS